MQMGLMFVGLMGALLSAAVFMTFAGGGGMIVLAYVGGGLLTFLLATFLIVSAPHLD